jgi:hypothetical protein
MMLWNVPAGTIAASPSCAACSSTPLKINLASLSSINEDQPPGLETAGFASTSSARAFGTLNLNQTGGSINSEAIAVMTNGRRGLKRAHNWAPNQGAGREMNPRLLKKTPEKVPNRRAGTTLETRDW